MANKIYLSILSAAFIFFPIIVFGHMVPWNERDPAFDYLRQNNDPELAYHLARYCYVVGEKPDTCVNNLFQEEQTNNINILVAYALCMREIEEIDPNLQKIMHPVNPGLSDNTKVDSSNGSWHMNYIDDGPTYGKSGDGVHRHEYSESQADQIGHEHATKVTNDLKKLYDGTTQHYGEKQEDKANVNMGLELNFKVIKGGAGKDTAKTSTTSTQTKQQGLTPQQIKVIYDAEKSKAKNNPSAYDTKSRIPANKYKKDEKYGVSSESTTKPLNKEHPDNKKPPKDNDPTNVPQDPPNLDDTLPTQQCYPDPAKPEESGFCPDVSPDMVISMVTEPSVGNFKQDIKACVNKVLAPNLVAYPTESDTPTDGRPKCVIAMERLHENGVCDEDCFSEDFCWTYNNKKIVNIIESSVLEGAEKTIDKNILIINIEGPSKAEERREYCDRLLQWIESLKKFSKSPKTGSGSPMGASNSSNSSNTSPAIKLSNNLQIKSIPKDLGIDMPAEDDGLYDLSFLDELYEKHCASASYTH